MGWFSEQIHERIQNDNAAFEDSFRQMADSILGTRLSAAARDSGKNAKAAVDAVLQYYRIQPREHVPSGLTDINDLLDYMLRPGGLMRRTVRLTGKWYTEAFGAMLGVLKESGEIVALLPGRLGGYVLFRPSSDSRSRITSRTASLLAEEALCFYKPFPQKKLGVPDLYRYILSNLSVRSVVFFAVLTLLVTGIGMLEPYIHSYLVGNILLIADEGMLHALAAFFIGVIVSKLLFSTVATVVNNNIFTRIDLTVVSATMMRILSLPPAFFKDYSAGELFSRTESMSSLCSMLITVLFSAGLSSLFSLLYIGEIFRFAPSLVIPAVLIILATFLCSVFTTLLQQKVSKRRMELSAKEVGLSYAMLTGIRKIRLAAAEKRSFARWAAVYSEKSRLEYNPSRFLVLSSVLTTAITLTGNVILMQSALAAKLTASSWTAFNAAFGMLSGAFSTLASIGQTVSSIRPVLGMVRPILEAVPEVAENRTAVTGLSGAIDIDNVSFRYTESGPLVLDDLSLSIRPGQYIAICGRTGCGKSTLIRLLLGFETPLNGTVYYDKKDIATLDLRSLRRNIGTVMQDGKLMQGDIFSNIVIAAPHLKLADAWEAAELAGIADDIRAMPMGMHTILSEGTGGISGGQRQRLMIARAIAPKPGILIFDEATSALDNITQKQVSDALDALKCTRIVIAHRLSTIRHADRILVLDGGHIAEDGTYEELMQKNGFFAGLVKRQQVDTPSVSDATEEKGEQPDAENCRCGK